MRALDSVGLIGGGQMGEALIRGLIGSGLLAPDRIMVVEPEAARQQYLQEQYRIISVQTGQLVSSCSIVILAIKPQIMERVLQDYRGLIGKEHLVISIAAGIPLRTLENLLGQDIPLIRVMPNTPCLVLAGASALSGNLRASRADMAAAEAIFSSVGSCVELPESALDAVTGLSGSGPGYVFTFIEAMIDGGVLAGLPRQVAEKLVLQTVYGSAKLAMESGEAAAVLKGKVTSPGGTTIAGIEMLENRGLRGAVMSAIKVAALRSEELGR